MQINYYNKTLELLKTTSAERLEEYFLQSERLLKRTANTEEQTMVMGDCLDAADAMYTFLPKEAERIYSKLETSKMLSMFLVAKSKATSYNE